MIISGYILLSLLWLVMLAVAIHARQEILSDIKWTWKYIRRSVRVYLIKYWWHRISSVNAKGIINHTAMMVIIAASLMIALS
jgi:hypothetical protein